MTIALIILFVIPSAIALGCLKQEATNGQLDVLSTIPYVKSIHSVIAWNAVGLCGIFTYGITGMIFFKLILVKSSLLIPIVGLSLMGISLGKYCLTYSLSLSIALTCLIRPDICSDW